MFSMPLRLYLSSLVPNGQRNQFVSPKWSCTPRSTYILLPSCSILDSYQDPFEEYKTRQQKRRAKKAEAHDNARLARSAEKKEEDELNWFGVKLGSENTGGSVAEGGVGRYLQGRSAAAAPKRPASSVATTDVSEEGKKKRKIGFGQFDGW